MWLDALQLKNSLWLSVTLSRASRSNLQAEMREHTALIIVLVKFKASG